MTSPTPEEALASVIRDAMEAHARADAKTTYVPIANFFARAILASGYALPTTSGEYGALVANALARMNGRVDVMTFNERSEHGGGFSTHAEVRCVGDNEREQSQVAWCCDEEDARVIASIPAMARAISSLSAEKEILQTALGAMRATIKGELGELILDLGRVEGSLDSQTYDEMRKQDDWPDDAEFHVVLTARDLRKISEANTLLVRTMMNALNASEEKADLRAQLAAAREALANMEDNYDGAMADCTSAVDVLIRRINGEATLESAAEWVRLNYPKMAAALSGAPR